MPKHTGDRRADLPTVTYAQEMRGSAGFGVDSVYTRSRGADET
jgi:hypothetical protein